MPFARNALDSCRIYFEDDGGSGTPVVLLGGFLDPTDLVRGAPIPRVLVGMRDEFRTIFVDHRGHGRSDKPHDPAAYAMPLRVADVVAVLDQLEIARAHLVGISWGGRLGFGLGSCVPGRLRSIVIIGQHPYAIDPEGPLTQAVGDALSASETRGIEALVETFESFAGRYPEPARKRYLEADPLAMRAAWRTAISEGAIGGELGAWRVPSLICVAEGDVDFFEQARRAAAEIPDAEFVVVDATDHLGMDTADVDPMLEAVLRTLRARAVDGT